MTTRMVGHIMKLAGYTPGMTTTDLMSKVQKSFPQSYESVEVLSDKDMTFAEVPAVMSVFTGADTSHDGLKTQSVVLAFVKDGHGYVVSARTRASQFKARQALLEKLVCSIAFSTRSVSK